MTSIANHQRDAERRIARILADLEKTTGQYVDSIEVRTIEVTRIQDDRPMHSRSVAIYLRPQPGSQWVLE